MQKTFSPDFDQAIDEIKPHDHFSLVYENQQEQFDVVIPFIQHGFLQGFKCVYVFDESNLETILKQFTQAGLGVDNVLQAGNLVMLNRAKTPLDQANFDPERAKAYLESLVRQSRKDGYAQLGIIEEMPWELADEASFETLLSYETVLNQFYLNHSVCGISQFDRTKFSPDYLLKIIKTHRFVIFQKDIFTNPFYISPDRYDSGSQGERDLESMLSGLKDLKIWEAELVETIRNLRYLVEINKMISGSMDLDKVTSEALSNILKHMNAGAAALLIYDPDSQVLKYETSRGFLEKYDLTKIRLKLNEFFSTFPDLQNQSTSLQQNKLGVQATSHLTGFEGEAYETYYSVLLKNKESIVGMMEVYLPESVGLVEKWQPYVEALANQLASAIENAHVFHDLQQKIFELTMAYDVTIARFAKAMDKRDNHISRNSQRLAEMTERLAREMGASEEELAHIRRGVLLQDISKLSLPDKILQKPGPLTDKEWQVMYEHPQMVFDLLEDIKLLRPALEIPYCHHENWDGSGYPRGLEGTEIPLAARQFAVVNVYDALLTDRPYRPSWDEVDALAYVRSLSGTQFDPEVVDSFLRMLER